MHRTSSALAAVAGMMGVAGVALAAWSAHKGGGDLAMTAAYFLLFHAAPVLTLGLVAGQSRMAAPIAAAMALGAGLFSGALAALALGAGRPLPFAAPVGGLLLIGAWAALAVAGATRAIWPK